MIFNATIMMMEFYYCYCCAWIMRKLKFGVWSKLIHCSFNFYRKLSFRFFSTNNKINFLSQFLCLPVLHCLDKMRKKFDFLWFWFYVWKIYLNRTDLWGNWFLKRWFDLKNLNGTSNSWKTVMLTSKTCAWVKIYDKLR